VRNAGGGEWCAKCTDLATVDGWWVNTVLALVGEAGGGVSEGITGARMVDKSDGKQGHVGYRIEVWYKAGADANGIHDLLLEKVVEDLNCERPKFSRKNHPAVVKPAGKDKGKGGAAATPRPVGEEGAAADNEAAAAESRKVWQRQMRSIMAKITPEKLARLAPQLAALISGADHDDEGANFAAEIIHKNALHEALFAETYSEVCISLDKIPGFRKAVVERCKTKFAARVTDVANATGDAVLERKGARANVRFIVELHKRQLVPAIDIVHIAKLLVQCTRDDKEHRAVQVECLTELLSAGGASMEKAQPADMDAVMKDIAVMSKDKEFETRHRFNLEAVVEQRSHGWRPRREKEKPLTKEEQEEALRMKHRAG